MLNLSAKCASFKHLWYSNASGIRLVRCKKEFLHKLLLTSLLRIPLLLFMKVLIFTTIFALSV